MTDFTAVVSALTVLVPLFVGTTWVMHQMREERRTVGPSLLLNAAVWVAIWFGLLII